MKRSVMKAFGLAAAASTVVAVTPTPAFAHSPTVSVRKYFTNQMYVTMGAGDFGGPNIRVWNNAANPSVVYLDSNVPITNAYPEPGNIAYQCSLGASGVAARPYRATCTGITENQAFVFGSGGADNITTAMPGHVAQVYGEGGADTLTGSNLGRDVLRGGGGADTINIAHANDAHNDTAYCGGADGGVQDTVRYNGSDGLEGCNAADNKIYGDYSGK